MKLIVAVDKNWGIGKDGKMLFHLPEDLKYFKEKTTGKTVIMGRKTLESLPNGKPLPNRDNIVLTRSDKVKPSDNLKVAHSKEELFSIVDINSDDVFLIGGAELYNSMLTLCDELLITKIDAIAQADTFLINVDEHPDYICSDKGEWLNSNGLRYRFTRYTRKIHM